MWPDSVCSMNYMLKAFDYLQIFVDCYMGQSGKKQTQEFHKRSKDENVALDAC